MSYLPVTAGSSWNYHDDANTNGNSTVTMTGATAIFNGKTYFVATSVSAKDGSSSTGYFYAGNHIYSIRGSHIEPGVTDELQIGDDNVAAGYTWTSVPTDDGHFEGFDAQTVNTVKEKNITKIVNGVAFSNVIHTQINFLIGSESNAVYDIYLAKGVGLIQQDTRAYGLLVSSRTITGYTIK